MLDEQKQLVINRLRKAGWEGQLTLIVGEMSSVVSKAAPEGDIVIGKALTSL